MSRLQRALLAGLRAGMPILVLGLLITAASHYLGSPQWVVNVVFATTVSCALVKTAWVAWQRWSEASPARGICPHCKVAPSDSSVASAFCRSCGAWTKPAAES